MSECAIGDCNTKQVAKGLCGRHYQQWRLGRLDYVPPAKQARTCCIDGCTAKYFSTGYCMAHKSRAVRGTDMSAPVAKRIYGDAQTRLRAYATGFAPDECWEWTRGRNNGYGTIAFNGKTRLAHVVAWEVHAGRTVPTGMVIRHTCDNPPCVNPTHLLLGTHADNEADKIARGRQSRGEGRPNAVLTDVRVREIRALADAGMRAPQLAARFGIGQGSIRKVIRRDTWKHVE